MTSSDLNPDISLAEVVEETKKLDMNDISFTLGRLEERLANSPSAARQFWSSAGGAAVVAGLAIGIIAIFLPREIDSIRRDLGDLDSRLVPIKEETVINSNKLDEILEEIKDLKNSSPKVEDVTLLTAQMREFRQNQIAQSMRLAAVSAQFRNDPTFARLEEYSASGDRDSLTLAINNLSQSERDALLSMVTMGLIGIVNPETSLEPIYLQPSAKRK